MAGRASEQVAGVVVEPADDLDLAAVGQVPVGNVGLPDRVGLRGLEADPGAAWAFARLGYDEAGGMQDAPDGGRRGGGQALTLEVPGDGGGTRVEAAGGELAAQGGDPVTDDAGRPLRASVRPPGPRLEVVETALPVPREETMQVLAAK
jgi:hypothetical protein